jgi:hypothetical protein
MAAITAVSLTPLPRGIEYMGEQPLRRQIPAS